MTHPGPNLRLAAAEWLRFALEEADNAPAGPPTIYRGCTASPEGAALGVPGEREPLGWGGAGGELSTPSRGWGWGRGDSELLE